jgi:hypothetical protein
MFTYSITANATVYSWKTADYDNVKMKAHHHEVGDPFTEEDYFI